MCRLLGFVTRRPVTLADLLGGEDLRAFTELSSRHCDGWGFAWPDGRDVQIEKATGSARHSADFARAASQRPSDIGLVHLRQATMGLGIGLDNTHPFRHGQVAFAHNGSISPPESLDALMPSDLAALRRGTTDSERYFLAVLGAARDAGVSGGGPAQGAHATPHGAAALADGLADTAHRIAQSLTSGGLNALVVTPDHLIAVCRFDPAAQEREPEPEYYCLRYRVTDDAVVVSSSGWGAGWQTLGNGELLAVDRTTLAVSIRPIARGAAA